MLLALVGLVLTGCRRPPFERVSVYPVSGQLFIRGKPAANAKIQFHSLDDVAIDHLRPHAIVEADGSYRLTTFVTGDGAPAGLYAVTVTWPAAPKRRFDPEGPDQLKGRYVDSRRPLRKVVIAPGGLDIGRSDIK
jgi:hypothetical protein